VRTPQDLPPRAAKRRHGRARWWILGAVVVLVVLLLSLKSLANLYTDSLWFSSVHFHRVWSTLLAIKVGLFASFGAVFFVAMWVNLLICDRLGASAPSPGAEDELVRRYQQGIRPHSGWVYAVLAALMALIAASGALGEWNNWILFTHGVSFGVKDPQFGLDVGFFVFKLPFLEFMVNWLLVVLVIILVVTVVFHYLNGGIRAQRISPRVLPSVKVHLSVLLALIALVKAAGYALQRYQLDTSTSGYVEGAGYTDVHARLPAIELLFFVSLFAVGILLYNIRRQGWTLPVLAIGVWAFVALAIGVIYPAVLQAIKVNPAQSTLEKPYIKRNIQATRAAYGLDHVKISNFKGNTSLTAREVGASITTLDNVRLWDPSPAISLPAFQKLQDLRSYYTFQSVAVDRYTIDGKMRPVIVGVRQLNPTNLPSNGWVNTHLEYTHGEGLVLAEASQTTTEGNPTFSIQDVPATSSNGLPKVTQPAVYFGLNDPGYVIADTRQAELDYQTNSGTDVDTHYKGPGGVELSNFLTKAAFAVRMGDLNILTSNLITPQSKMMFVRTVQAMAEKAAPFLSFGSHPYAALVDGHIDWIIHAYTTTDEYPYSENADTEQVPPTNGLPASYNYIRNSVDVVVNAYSGKMTFYAMDNDPILRTYEAAFPGMFTPGSQMSSALRAHLRYPEDLFSIQAAVYGRYHITSPGNFYTAGDAWSLSPTAGAGSATSALAVTLTTDAQGQVIGTTLQRMAPLYQVLAEPGQTKQSFTISDAYVSAAQGSGTQTLSAFMMASSDPGDYGHLHVYVTTPGSSVTGPSQADSYIEASTTVSTQITRLDRSGSQVLLGNILMVPIDQSMLYIRPLYTEATGNPQPQVKEVIAVYGKKVRMASSLDAVLSKVLGTKVGTGSTSVTTSSTSSVAPSKSTSTQPVGSSILNQANADLTQASSDYSQAQADLQKGTLGGYQSENAAAEQEEAAAKALLGTVSTTTPSTTPTTPSKTTPSKTTPSTTKVKSGSKSNTSGSKTSTSGKGSTTTTAPTNEA